MEDTKAPTPTVQILETVDTGLAFTVSPGFLKKIIIAKQFTWQKDCIRAALGCVCFDFRNGRMRVVGTDAYRLYVSAWVDCEIKDNMRLMMDGFWVKVMVDELGKKQPITFKVVRHRLQHGDDTPFWNTHYQCSTPEKMSDTTYAGMIDGVNYPSFQDVIPVNTQGFITMPARVIDICKTYADRGKAFMKGMKAREISKEPVRVSLRMRKGSNEVALDYNEYEHGGSKWSTGMMPTGEQAREMFDVTDLTLVDDEMGIFFNPIRLYDTVRHIPQNVPVTVGVSLPTRAICFHSGGTQSQDVDMFMIMPVLAPDTEGELR